MDRTLLILDIFAARAVSGEGKIQVELAQLKYRASRLAGLGKSLSDLEEDTVGFINKLPHHLVEAFKAHWKKRNTRISSFMWSMLQIRIMDAQMFVVYETLRQLGAKENRSLPV